MARIGAVIVLLMLQRAEALASAGQSGAAGAVSGIAKCSPNSKVTNCIYYAYGTEFKARFSSLNYQFDCALFLKYKSMYLNNELLR